MKVTNAVNQIIGYFSDAITVIFSVDRGDHPPAGVQPFTGKIYRRHSHHA
jgi:hypothetical protein